MKIQAPCHQGSKDNQDQLNWNWEPTFLLEDALDLEFVNEKNGEAG